MKKRLVIGLVLSFLIATVALAIRSWGPRGRPESDASSAAGVASDPVHVLRADFYSLDFEAGVVHGRRLWAQHPDRPEVAAWYALNAARGHNDDEALQVAERMPRADDRNPWAEFALAAALIWDPERSEDALRSSGRALERAPDSADVLWLRAETLRLRRPKDDAIAFLDAHAEALASSAELLVVKGAALYDKALEAELDPATRTRLEGQALDVFERARRVDPTSVGAHYTPAWFLTSSRRSLEAYPLLKRAAQLSPSPKIQHAFWQAVQGNWELTADQKEAILTDSLDRFVERRPELPSTLTIAIGAARQMGLTTWRQRLQGGLDRKQGAAGSAATEDVVSEALLMDRLDDMSQRIRTGQHDPALVAAYRAGLNEFIDRPEHHDQLLLDRACIMLFHSVRADSSVPSRELLRVVDVMKARVKGWPHVVHAEAAIALVDRGDNLDQAEKLAQAGVAAIPGLLEEARNATRSSGDDPRRRNKLLATMHDALGRVYHRQKRLQEAEKELQLAYGADRRFPPTALHLAQLHESRGELDKAERFYLEALSLGGEVHDESVSGLANLYSKRHGSDEGYAEYLAKAKRASVASSRIASPTRPDAFELEDLKAGKVSLAALRGKYVVVVFWALWCPVCRQEIPQLAQLHETYKSSKDVALLSVNCDRNPDLVRAFMKDRGHEFGVLLDDGYAERSGVVRVPTIWFLDKQGRKIFEMGGGNDGRSLLEEVDLRLAFLRQQAS